MGGFMQIEGIDRLVIGVKDMDRALRFFGDVLGVRFTEITGPAAEAVGCRLAISLDHKLELICPVAEPRVVTNPPDPLELRRRLQHAEAVLYALIFKVPDLDAAVANAAHHGVGVVGDRVEFERDPQLRVSGFREVALAEPATFGIKMALSQYVRDPPAR